MDYSTDQNATLSESENTVFFQVEKRTTHPVEVYHYISHIKEQNYIENIIIRHLVIELCTNSK